MKVTRSYEYFNNFQISLNWTGASESFCCPILVTSIFSLREKCPNTEFFLVPIFQCSDLIRRFTSKSLYSVQIQESADQKKLRIWTLFAQCLAWSYSLFSKWSDVTMITLPFKSVSLQMSIFFTIAPAEGVFCLRLVWNENVLFSRSAENPFIVIVTKSD